jgi:hypothetical protein
LNDNQSTIIIVAAVVIVVAVVVAVMRLTGGGMPVLAESTYYDTVTKELFRADASLIPPIQSPKGNPATRVHYFSCGSCSDDDNRFVAFYEKYTNRAKQALEAAAAEGDIERTPQQQLILEEHQNTGVRYSMDGESWFEPSDADFMEKLDEKLSQCDGPMAKPCATY